MDITDTEGDGNSQIYTVPVKFGKATALLISGCAWIMSTMYGSYCLWNGAAVKFWSPRLSHFLVQPCACLPIAVVMLPMLFGMHDAYKSSFDSNKLKKLIDDAIAVLGKGLLILTIMG